MRASKFSKLFQALEQFETSTLGSFKFLILTNFNVELIFNLLIITLVIVFAFSNSLVIFNNASFFGSSTSKFAFNVLYAQTGKSGIIYFPIILSVFIFIVISNFNGLMPGNFCITSQIFVTFTLSSSVFVGAVILSIIIQGSNFIWFFVPKNVPFVLLPFITCIEIISYISRVFSLAIRLFANMVAGHALLHIIGGAVVLAFKKLGSLNLILSLLAIFPLLILLAIILLEFGVAFLQAYVFIVLFSIYLNDCYGHH